MRLSRKQRHHGIAFDITPMIDVVFQLIIFFMTCSQISAIDRAAVDLPKLHGQTDAGNRDLSVNIQADGGMLVLNNPTTVRQLELMIKTLAEERGGPERLTIALRVDAAAKSAAPNAVIKALVGLGVKRGASAVESSGLTGD
jgi:biopolymer transport protein ExbD